MPLSLRVMLPCLLVAAATLVQSASAETKRIMDCTLDSKDLDKDCDTNGYIMRLAYMAAPGIAVGVLLLLCCPIFHCCHCCGCCGAGKVNGPRSSCDVVRAKVYTLVCFILICISGGLFGNINSGELTGGLFKLADDLDALPSFITNELGRIENSMIVTRYNKDTDSFYEDNLFAGSSLGKSGNDTKQSLEDSISGVTDDFRSYVEQFSFVLFLLFTVPIGIMFFGLVAAGCNIRSCLPMLVAAFFFLLGAILFILYGVSGALSLALGDVCAEVHGASLGQKTLLPVITACDSSQFSAFTDSFSELEKSVSSSSCKQIREMCYIESQTPTMNLYNTRVYDCGTSFPNCDEVFFSDMVTLVDGGVYTHPKIRSLPQAIDEGATCRDTTLQCSVKECGEGCTVANGTLSKTGKSSKEMYYSFKAAESVSFVFDTLGARYGSCESLFNLIFAPFDAACTAIVSGSINTREAYGWTGMNAVTAILCMIMGATKFMSFLEAKNTREPKDLDEAHEVVEVQEQTKDTPM